MPILMIWGEQEKPEASAPLPESAEVFVIPDANHAGALEAVDIVVPAIREFIAQAKTQ